MEAVLDLQHTLGLLPGPAKPVQGLGNSESWAQSAVRLEASKHGVTLWRNNVGALKDETGRVVRYGLANESKSMNEAIKSSDLIGWRPVIVTPAHVGHQLAVFVARECKEPGWQFRGDPRERAQEAFINLVNAAGGDARFTTGALDGPVS